MKKWILPAVACVAVVAAIVVMVVQPGQKTEAVQLNADASGSVMIRTADLSSEEVTFVRPMENSNIELLARIGDDGEAKVALGTCQSCNGAPGAYYTQEDDVLKCNNCGLTFPVDVVDAPGDGCHPITLDEAAYSLTDEGIELHTEVLTAYESLFDNVAEH